jgi:hypothetical protein
MPLRRLRKRVRRPLNETLLRAYAYQATRLRDLAAGATTAPIRALLLEEAVNQERLAEAARHGTIRPEPQRAQGSGLAA